MPQPAHRARKAGPWGSFVLVLLYLLVVQASNFLHHDPQCHQTSRTPFVW